MAWIESHQKLLTEPKLFDLMASMGWSRKEAIGALHMFWWWCVDHAEDGYLNNHNDSRLALAVELNPSDGKQFVEAMLSAGFLERCPHFRVVNWWKFIGRFMKQRYKDKPEIWKKMQKKWEESITDTVTVTVTETFTQETNRPNQPNQPNQTDVNTTAINNIKSISRLLQGQEGLITAGDPTPLVDLLYRHGLDYMRVWATIVQARGKENPAGYLVKCLADPNWMPSDMAMGEAKREQKKLEE